MSDWPLSPEQDVDYERRLETMKTTINWKTEKDESWPHKKSRRIFSTDQSVIKKKKKTLSKQKKKSTCTLHYIYFTWHYILGDSTTDFTQAFPCWSFKNLFCYDEYDDDDDDDDDDGDDDCLCSCLEVIIRTQKRITLPPASQHVSGRSVAEKKRSGTIVRDGRKVWLRFRLLSSRSASRTAEDDLFIMLIHSELGTVREVE